jgi:hypothetical protein
MDGDAANADELIAQPRRSRAHDRRVVVVERRQPDCARSDRLAVGSRAVDAGEFASAITFDRYGPDCDLADYARESLALARRGTSLEMVNTRLPSHEPQLRERLGPLLAVSRMSTFAIGAIINVGVAAMPPGAIYLNVGVWHGFTLLAGMADNASHPSVGVDDFSQFGGPRAEFLERFDRRRGAHDAFHDLRCDDYFDTAHGGRPIGFYLYDGGHGYDEQIKGLLRAEPFLVPGALILVDDTNWANPRRATMDFLASRPGAYELLVDYGTKVNRHPTFWNGIMLIRRRTGL